MKIKVAQYVAQKLVDNNITDIFTVVGGGAMHLNDALGHKEGLKVTYNYHEQACAIAAEAYARLDNKIAAVCVTTGPGGTNALTGVVEFLCGHRHYDLARSLHDYAFEFEDKFAEHVFCCCFLISLQRYKKNVIWQNYFG